MYHTFKYLSEIFCFRIYILTSLLILSCLFSNVQGAAIGLPASTIQFGIGTNFNLMVVNDEQGATNRKVTAQPGSFYVTDWLLKGTRYLGELYLSKYTFAAEADHIGEQVDNKGARFSVQFNAKHGKHFSPWYGVGLDFSHAKFTKRHKVDDEGFLIEKYEDLSQPSVNFLVNIMESWKMSSNLALGAMLAYSIPISQSVNGFSASMLLIYRPRL